MTRRPLLFAASLALAAPLAPNAVRAAPAAPDIDVPFVRYTLDNGLEVVLHRDPTTPIIAVDIWYHVGSGDEVAGKSGFAHLFEHMMFQGSAHTGSDVHFPILKQIGASAVNGTTNSYRTNYFETVPAHQIETALWLESDRMGWLLDLVTPESMHNQIDVVRNERRQRYDGVPYGKARFATAAALYPEGHPYRYLTIGRHEDIENAQIDDVKAFFRKWYVPSNATLTIAGDFDVDDMKALVAKWFGDLPTAPKPTHGEVAPPVLAATTHDEVQDEFAKLEQVQRTWVAPKAFSDDNYALTVLAEVLGADGWGRLSKRLTIADPQCTSIRVGLDERPLSSELSIVAQLKPGADRNKVLAVIDEELGKIEREPISDAELHRVVIGTEASFVEGLEDLASRADRLAYFDFFTGDPGFASTYLAKLRAVTPDAVLAAAKTWLTKPYAEVVSIPAKKKPDTKGAKP